MMRDMALPAVQRDALIERIAEVVYTHTVSHGLPAWADTTPQLREYFRDTAREEVAVIEEQYVLLPRDQVTAERKISGPAAPLWIGKGVGPSGRTCVSRLVTPWRKVSE